jgi:hypothetical protein
MREADEPELKASSGIISRCSWHTGLPQWWHTGILLFDLSSSPQ